MITKTADLFTQLLRYTDQVNIIDTHEHLPSEEWRVAQSVDFFTLFSHYCVGDMVAAGMAPGELKTLESPDAPVEKKWAVFAPYYNLVKNGSYARAARIAMQRFYDFSDLTCLEDAEVVTERIRQHNQPGLYQHVLVDTCRLKTSIVFTNEFYESNYFNFVYTVDHLVNLNHIEDLRVAVTETGGSAYTLADYVESLQNLIRAKASKGVKGIKFTTAYYRTLEFDNVPTAEADRIFNKLSSAPYLISDRLGRSIDNREVMVLQDYLTLRVLDVCDQLGLPVIFHTGLHAGNRNNPANARPEPLWRQFYAYPNLNFILLHGALPWVHETAMLAKSYPNVYIDMAWMHIISPEISQSTLKGWIDLLPKNKILGFGGDYLVVEKVYGHLVLAKENICRALGEKAAAGAMTEAEACSWIDHLLHDNAARLYHL